MGVDGMMNKRCVALLVRRVSRAVNQRINKKITPHVMRHTAATSALRNGMPLEQGKEFPGYSNPNTTMVYAKIDAADIKRSHEKYLG